MKQTNQYNIKCTYSIRKKEILIYTLNNIKDNKLLKIMFNLNNHH